MRLVTSALALSLLWIHGMSSAQTPEPVCASNPEILQANKRLVLDFFASEAPLKARAEQFLAQHYIQHNPRLRRLDEINGTSGRESWYRGIEESVSRSLVIADLGGIRLTNPIIVMAECDLVTAIYKGVLNDPDKPGRSYEAFAFETFRIRDGKLAEHWDQVQLVRNWMQPK